MVAEARGVMDVDEERRTADRRVAMHRRFNRAFVAAYPQPGVLARYCLHPRRWPKKDRDGFLSETWILCEPEMVVVPLMLDAGRGFAAACPAAEVSASKRTATNGDRPMFASAPA